MHTQQNVLPPVPISTKLEGDDMKQQIMELYPDLFSGVGTIKNAIVHLDVKPGTVPVVCSPHCVVFLSRDPRKVEAISNMPVLSNKTELQSYIGMCNFLSSYVPHLTDRLYVLQ